LILVRRLAAGRPHENARDPRVDGLDAYGQFLQRGLHLGAGQVV
jgi:hypothetical protein